ncbi:MAG: DUF5658 family protein [Planctomycetota bacterium]|nr:DUF5658 family protein [Planctomycetota bacterium]
MPAAPSAHILACALLERCRSWGDPSARARRVFLLLVAIAIMSAADLALTLIYATTIGMVESNPVARLVMSHNSPELLSLWKLSTFLVAAVILFLARRHRTAELAAWLASVALVWLMLHWAQYVAFIASSPVDMACLARNDARFVVIDATP